jgi:hypothetical protein
MVNAVYFKGDKRKMINTKTKGELGRRIEYDVEHNLFHPQNIYSDEYITPTFVEYVQELEKENAELKKACDETQELLDKQIEATLKLDKENAELKAEWQEQVQKATDEGYARTLQTIQLTKAKEIIKAFLDSSDLNIKHKAEEFLGEF